MKNPLCNEEHYEVNCILGNCWGGATSILVEKNGAFRGNRRIMYKSLARLQKGIKIEFCPIRTTSRLPASSQFLSVPLVYSCSTAIIFMAS